MASGDKAPDTPVAAPATTEVNKTPEHHITSSIVEKRDFSETELGLINTRLHFLENKAKEGLKEKEAKLTLTPEKIAKLKADLAKEGTGEKKLTREMVEIIIDEKDFEKETTPKTVADTVKDTILERGSSALSAVVGVKTADAIVKEIQVGGIMNIVKKFIYEISKLFSFLSGSKNTMSYEANEIYTNCIEQQLRDAGILSPLTADEKPEKGDIEAGSQFMGKISALGIPLEYADLYLPFITNSITDITKIPPKLQSIFTSGKTHFATLQPLDNSDPQRLIDTMFDFKVAEETPAAPAGGPVAAASAETAPVKPTIEAVKFKNGDKDVTLEAAPESATSFRKIQKTAETVLGKDELKADDILKTAYEGSKDAYEKEGAKKQEIGTTILENAAEKIALALTNKVKVNESITVKGQTVDWSSEDKIKARNLDGLAGDIETYLIGSFDKIYTRLEKSIDGKTEITDEAKKLLKEKLVGYLREKGSDGEKKFSETTKDGYALAIKQILWQEKTINDLRLTTQDGWNGLVLGKASPAHVSQMPS